jgi:hypothetical protein
MVKSDLAGLAPGCPGNGGRLRRHGAVQPERLGPAIGAFEEPKQGVDARIQVRTRRLGFIAFSPAGYIAGKNFSGQPLRTAGETTSAPPAHDAGFA